MRGNTDMERVGKLLGPRTKETETNLVPRNPRKTQQQTNVIAEKLVDTFGSPSYRNFFLKAAWRLPEAKIFELVEIAKAKATDNARSYFIALVRNEDGF
jgi:hypothetical protein